MVLLMYGTYFSRALLGGYCYDMLTVVIVALAW
jgi:hypothetical protein